MGPGLLSCKKGTASSWRWDCLGEFSTAEVREVGLRAVPRHGAEAIGPGSGLLQLSYSFSVNWADPPERRPRDSEKEADS